VFWCPECFIGSSNGDHWHSNIAEPPFSPDFCQEKSMEWSAAEPMRREGAADESP
jgi:hypothetical protein